jgi:hypothetical protein
MPPSFHISFYFHLAVVFDQVSHSYITTGKIIVFIFNLYVSISGDGKTEDSELNVIKHFLNSVCF